MPNPEMTYPTISPNPLVELPVIVTDKQVIHYDPLKDAYRRYLTDSPTARKFSTILRQVDQGDVAALVEVNEEIEGKDSRLQAVANTRRSALTSLDYAIEVDPKYINPDGTQDGFAEEVAGLVAEHLESIENFPVFLEHMATAIGPNVAVTELIWDLRDSTPTIVGFTPVPGHRLKMHPEIGLSLYVERGTGDYFGVPCFPGKFVVYHPQTRGGFPLRATLTHAALTLFLIKHHNLVDWLAYSELYGQPWRVAYYEDSVVDDDRETAKKMLDNLSSDASAVLPQGLKVEFLQPSGEAHTYETLMKWVENAMSILYLGQTLTTDIGDAGSRAAAQVHDNVRGDLLIADVKSERRMMKTQVFKPLLAMWYPGRDDIPCPLFVRKLPERRNVDGERLDLDQLRFAREAKVELDRAVVYDRLSMPQPLDAEPFEWTSEEKEVDGVVERPDNPAQDDDEE